MKKKSVKKSNSVSVTTDDLALMVQKGFVGIDKRFDGVDKRFDGIDTRLDGIDERLDGIDGRLDKIEGRLDGIENILLRNHNNRIERLEDKILQVQVILGKTLK